MGLMFVECYGALSESRKTYTIRRGGGWITVGSIRVLDHGSEGNITLRRVEIRYPQHNDLTFELLYFPLHISTLNTLFLEAEHKICIYIYAWEQYYIQKYNMKGLL
jgi:hypothetical protein